MATATQAAPTTAETYRTQVGATRRAGEAAQRRDDVVDMRTSFGSSDLSIEPCTTASTTGCDLGVEDAGLRQIEDQPPRRSAAGVLRSGACTRLGSDVNQVAKRAETRQRLTLELPHALAREVELVPDRLERLRLALE